MTSCIHNRRSELAEDAVLLLGDWHWRRGPRWRALLAWAFGEREVFRTHLGDVAEVSWWRGDPYLLDLWKDAA